MRIGGIELGPRVLVISGRGVGGLGVVQVCGRGAAGLVEKVTGRAVDDRARLMDMGGVDEGLVVGMGEGWVQLMPHGGVRVVDRVAELLIEAGGVACDEMVEGADVVGARALYPEAACEMEAWVLREMGGVVSGAAVDVLFGQVERWRGAVESGERIDGEAVKRRSGGLDYLLRPATVAVVGAANVGKGTITNAVVGRGASITSDLPGTTRDWVGSMAELEMGVGGVVVRWVDTPGLHEAADEIERRAIGLARDEVERADVVVGMREPGGEWVEVGERGIDVWVVNKADTLDDGGRGGAERDGDGLSESGALWVSAANGAGLDRLGIAVGECLGLSAGAGDGLWAFCDEVREMLDAGDRDGLRRSVGLG